MVSASESHPDAMKTARIRMNRLLPVLVVLGTVTLLVAGGWALLNSQNPDDSKFEEAMLAAETARAGNRRFLAFWELQRASIRAISARQWQQVLKTVVQMMPEEARARDYRRVARLSSRAVSAIPGNQNFIAYLAWSKLRSGSVKKAKTIAENLHKRTWAPLKAEINTALYLKEKNQSLDDFTLKLESQADAEFFKEAAALTQSAELTIDAALAYMGVGKPSSALELAQEVMSEKRWWNNPENLYQRDVLSVLSRIAYEAGDISKTIEWMEQGLMEARERRMAIWEDLQFLGDIYWEKYRMQGGPGNLIKARNLWNEALDIAASEQKAWQIWISLSVLEEVDGNHRLSESILRTALNLFPVQNEVKATWARKHIQDNPSLVRRLVQNDQGNDAHPILAILSLQVDSESIPSRLYETRLWEMFEDIGTDAEKISLTDSRFITIFLLEYLSMRKNYASVDIAVERYRKLHPDENWILAWRLAADSSRHMSIIDLIAPMPAIPAPYVEYRRYVHEAMSWRGLHDTALFAFTALQELEEFVESISEVPSKTAPVFPDAALINRVLELTQVRKNSADTSFDERVRMLDENHLLTEKFRRQMNSTGPKGSQARAEAKTAILARMKSLIANAQEDLQLAIETPNLSSDNMARILYLKAAIMGHLGDIDEMRKTAEQALKSDPQNLRIRELLINGDSQ